MAVGAQIIQSKPFVMLYCIWKSTNKIDQDDIRSMQLQERKQQKTSFGFSFYFKCGAIFLLISLSALIAACSSGGTTDTNTNPVNLQQGPQPTVTIRIGNTNASPTPPLPPVWCGAWATQNTVSSTSAIVGVNAKFTRNVNGNPEGIAGANATASLTWPDGTPFTQTVQTSTDGLAVFSIPVVNKPNTINQIILVQVTFNKDGTTCAVNGGREAYFVLIVVSPTPTPTPNDNNNNGN